MREHGRRINCGAFTFAYLKRDSVSEFSSHPAEVKPEGKRLGVVASTAAVGHAVLRNRAKRRLREVFRRNQQVVPPGFDVLLTARNAVTTWPFTELEQKFVEACRQLMPAEKV